MDSLVKCHVLIQFHDLTDEQRQHLFNAEDSLRKAGITFDTGGYVGCNGGARDWEFDRGLSNNVTVWLKPNSPSNDN
jgi:hypothetical protein